MGSTKRRRVGLGFGVPSSSGPRPLSPTAAQCEYCQQLCVCVTPNYSTKSIVFAMIQNLSTALFALQQCFSFSAPCGFSSLSARQQDYVQSMHP